MTAWEASSHQRISASKGVGGEDQNGWEERTGGDIDPCDQKFLVKLEEQQFVPSLVTTSSPKLKSVIYF